MNCLYLICVILGCSFIRGGEIVTTAQEPLISLTPAYAVPGRPLSRGIYLLKWLKLSPAKAPQPPAPSAHWGQVLCDAHRAWTSLMLLLEHLGSQPVPAV